MFKLRSILEYATRRLSFRRRLPRSFDRVPLIVTPSAGLRYLIKSPALADPGLLSLAAEFVHKDAIIWDIGANIGLFSIASAQKSGANGIVVSIEPDTWLVQLLRRSTCIQPNTSASVKVVPAAVASEIAVRNFCLARRTRSANYLAGYGTNQAGGHIAEQHIITVTLDWLLNYFPAPTVLKIDVEGAEALVLQGAHHLFETNKPVVICEVGSDAQAEVSAFFLARGYHIYDGEQPRNLRQPLMQAPWCTLAIPNDTCETTS